MSKKIHKVACIGTHGVGKSTFCYQLAKLFKSQSKNVHIVQERVRFSPFPINTGMSVETAIWASANQVSKELEASQRGFDVIICDRCTYDTFMYAQYFNLNAPTLTATRKMAEAWLETYDSFYWIRPDMEPHDDGVRSTDLTFINGVDTLFEREVYPLVSAKTQILYTSDVFSEEFSLCKK
jgi:nicotinamide riboside kinase